MLSISEAEGDTGFAALKDDWEALCAGSPATTPFQTWEWITSWWRHQGRGRRLVLVARDGEATVGILPLVVTRYRGTPLRQVRFMGAPLSDVQDAITRPERARECVDAFLGHLANERGRWDVADLNDLREGCGIVEVSASLTSELEEHRRCPVIPLAPTWDAFLAGLGRKLRSNINRRRRNVEKDFRAEFSTADRSTLEEGMEALFQLHNLRWRRRGASGAFSSPRVRAFHKEVSARFLERGWLRLHLLRLDGRLRAASYCFQLGERVYNYLPGFDPELARYGPGQLLMAYGIERAIADGAREFDLLRGDESYKYEWKAEDRRTMRRVLSHTTLRSMVARAGHRFERWVEHHGLRLQRRMWGGSGKALPAAEQPASS
jgi:CelD/BcsL family acetyltransferase involved in cellulose biosynthesis